MQRHHLIDVERCTSGDQARQVINIEHACCHLDLECQEQRVQQLVALEEPAAYVCVCCVQEQLDDCVDALGRPV